MDKILFILSSLILFTSCAEQYNIAGNSNIACLDGRMLYLRVSSAEKGQHKDIQQTTISVCLDSCKVVHGRFSFEGDVDSARMAMLYTGNQCVMPLVLENGNLNISPVYDHIDIEKPREENKKKKVIIPEKKK